MRIAQRLTALETLWPEPDRVITAGKIGSLSFWSWPVAFGVFQNWFAHRARYRHVAEVGSDWWGLTLQERDTAVQFEADELSRVQTLLGDDDGYEAWHDQADGWHGQYGRCDRETFEVRLRHGWSNADGSRGHPSMWLFRSVWPEWTPAMSDDDHARFDILVSRERAERLAPYLDSPQGAPHGNT